MEIGQIVPAEKSGVKQHLTERLTQLAVKTMQTVT